MVLGLAERAVGLVTGLGQGLWQAPGLLADFITAPFNDDDDFNGFWNTLASRTATRAATAFTELAQQGSGVSALTHETPIGTGLEAARHVGSQFAQGSLEGLGTIFAPVEQFGAEFIREPLSAILLAGSLADSPSYSDTPGVMNLLRRDTWQTATRLAEDISVGQAFWLIFTRDVLDPDESTEFRDTALFRYGSGTVDALARFTVDPDVLAGKAFKAGRLKYLIHDLRGPGGKAIDVGKVDSYFRSTRWTKHNTYLDSLADKAPAEKLHDIARQFFPGDQWALQKASILSKAPDVHSRELLLRAMMGDMRAVDRLETTVESLRGVHHSLQQARSATAKGTPTRITTAGTRLADQLDSAILDVRRTYLDEGIVSAHLSPDQRYDALFDVLNDPADLSKLNAAIDDSARLLGTAELTESMVGRQTTELRNRFLSRPGRDAAVYQTSAYDTPMRVVDPGWWAAKGAHRPHPVVDVSDPGAAEQLERMLRSAGVKEASRGKWITKLIDTPADTGERVNVWNTAVEAGMRAIAKDLAIPREQMSKLIEAMDTGRQRAQRIVERAYATGGRDLVPVEDPVHGRFLVALPLSASQHPYRLTVPDFTLVRRDLQRAMERGWIPRAGSKVTDIADSVFDSITWHWKANVILRLAWPIRVTLLDEQFRMMAKWGAAVGMANLKTGTQNIVPAYMKELGLNTPRRAGTAGATVGGLLGFTMAGPVGAAGGALLGGASGLRMLGNLAKVEELGFTQLTRGLEINGVSIPPAFGEPGDVANLYRRKVSSQPQLDAFLVEEHKIGRAIRRDSGRYRDIKPHEATHEAEWLRVLNRQWRADPLVRQVLRGDDIPAQMAWLDTADGQRYLRAVPEVRKRDVETWLETLNAYVLETTQNPELRQLMLNKEITGADLAKLFPDPASRPDIHGAAVDDALGKSLWMRAVDGFIDKSMTLLGAMPTDYLIRQPAFEQFYRTHMERLLVGRNDITGDELERLARQARDSALVDSKDLVYDLAERREFHHLLRNMIPFLGATEEVLTAWSKLGKENPEFAVRAVKAWTGIDKFREITWTDPDTNETYLTFPIPDFARALVNHSPAFLLRHALDDAGRVRLPKASFNMILQSGLGYGPYIQASVSEILKRKPSMEDTLAFAIPFGPSEGITDAFLAGWQRRILGRAKGLDDRSYASSWHRVFQHRLALMRQGQLPEIDWDDPAAAREFLADVDQRTNAAWNIGVIASFASPANPIFDSPLWPYAQMYQALQEVHGDKALEMFIDQAGEELVDVSAAMSKSNDGIPPTLDALRTREEFRDIVEAYPELGGFIVGTEVDVMASKYSGAVYDHQLRTPVAPGSPDTMRERLSPRERAEAPDVRLGWLKYSRLMDYVEAERISRGLPNLQVREAQDLALMKKLATAEIAAEHPAWATERETFDIASYDRKLEGFRKIIATPKLAGRLEVQSVKRYLDARDTFIGELTRREAAGGSGGLYTWDNADLEQLWRDVIGQLVERDPAFGPTYYRYFERDPMVAPKSGAMAKEVA